MSSYAVVANGDLSPQMNRLIAGYLQDHELGPEYENVMRDMVVNVLVIRGMSVQKAIQQAELASIFRAAEVHIRDAVRYRMKELLADPALDDWGKEFLDAFIRSSITDLATIYRQSRMSSAETTAEIAERRPNPRSEPLRARVRDVPVLPPPSPSRSITARPAGWMEKLSRQTFVIEE